MTQDEEYRRQRIEELEEENDLLRRSAEKFGELAERLNAKLRAERREREERRHRTRKGSARRQQDRKGD